MAAWSIVATGQPLLILPFSPYRHTAHSWSAWFREHYPDMIINGAAGGEGGIYWNHHQWWVYLKACTLKQRSGSRPRTRMRLRLEAAVLWLADLRCAARCFSVSV